jgi:hypothetical protein
MADSQKLTQQTDVLQEQIFDSLEKAQAQKSTLKRHSSRYIIANVVLGAIAALLAGTAGTVGRAETWKPIFLLAAVCPIGATVTAKLQTADQSAEGANVSGSLKR